jgi:protein-arginine kinase activator protein McsA
VRLKRQLAALIEVEDYESAAKCRDRISTIEALLESGGNFKKN